MSDIIGGYLDPQVISQFVQNRRIFKNADQKIFKEISGGMLQVENVSGREFKLKIKRIQSVLPDCDAMRLELARIEKAETQHLSTEHEILTNPLAVKYL